MSKKVSEMVTPFNVEILVSAAVISVKSDSGIILPDSAQQTMVDEVQRVMAVPDGFDRLEVGDMVKLKIGDLIVRDRKFVKGKTSNPNDEVEESNFIIDPNICHEVDGKNCMLVRPSSIALKINK